MNELDRFRSFRRGVAAPSEDAQRRAFARLTGAIVGEHEQGPRVLRLIRRRPGRTALVLAALAGAATAALFVSTPWTSSPGFLERAEAALDPEPGTVLHAKWEETWTSTNPTCTVRRRPNEIWIDQARPHRFRAVLEDFAEFSSGSAPDPRVLVCARGTVAEFRGTLDSQQALKLVPPGAERGSPVRFNLEPDPVKKLREAISAGRAHDEGMTQLAGRTVVRVRIDLPSCDAPDCPREPYMYVDPDSFHPVEERSFGAIGIAEAGLPLRVAQFQHVKRYLTFEYLPRSAASLALTR
jgi:hypothetical protein